MGRAVIWDLRSFNINYVTQSCVNKPRAICVASGALTLRELRGGFGELLQLPAQMQRLIHALLLSHLQRQVLLQELLNALPVHVPLLMHIQDSTRVNATYQVMLSKSSFL